MATPSSAISTALPAPSPTIPHQPQSWGKRSVAPLVLGYVFETLLIGLVGFMFFSVIGLAIGRFFPDKPKDIKPTMPPNNSSESKTAALAEKSFDSPD